MPAFSFTAPTVSAEQIAEERKNLAEEERKQLQKDLYGRQEDEVVETDVMIEKGLSVMEDAIAEIPEMEKADYLEALERAPQLVERESNPVAFLRFEGYNAWSAAKRLVDYWKVRKASFGADKAFLSMTLDGAMADLRPNLEKGICKILPDDASGRAVLFWDRIRSARPTSERDEVVRIMFYHLHTMCERVDTQKNGYVFMVNVSGYDLYTHFDRILSKRCLSVLNAVPTKLKAGHYCGGRRNSAYTTVAGPVLAFIIGKRIRMRKIFHRGSDQEVIAELSEYGLGAEHVSVDKGGMVSQRDLLDWIDRRYALEESRKE